MITVLLICHGLLAVTLLGALTHQAFAVWWPARAGGSFTQNYRAVRASAYSNAIVILFVVTASFGAVLYPTYRISVRPLLEQLRFNSANGIFELKEHLVAISLGLLPAYWYYWRQPLAPEHAGNRKAMTAILAVVVWYGFLVGHILNNIRGFGL